MEGCPPWTLFEPGDQLVRFVDRGADRPGNKVCIFLRYNRQMKLIRPEIALATEPREADSSVSQASANVGWNAAAAHTVA